MADSNKRIVVDGVEFKDIFQFPRIIGAAMSSFQPPRLVIALLMVVAVMTAGRIWDALTEPHISHYGLQDGIQTASERADHQASLRSAVLAFAPTDRVPADQTAWTELRTRKVLSWIEDGYERHRDRLDDQSASADQKADLERQYLATVADIESTRPRGSFEATITFIAGGFGHMLHGIRSLSPATVVDGLSALIVRLPLLLWGHVRAFAIIFGLIVLVIFAVGGGAISRMAACQAANQERLRVSQAMDFALANWGKLVTAQGLPLLIVAAIAGLIVLLGIVMEVPVLDVIAALLYGLVLLLGFLLAFLLLGFALGFPLLIPAVACENCDGADAMQRSYAYTITRPLHLLGYWVVALVGLFLGFLVAGLIAVLMLNLTAALFGTLTDNPAMAVAGGFELFNLRRDAVILPDASWHSRWAASILIFWQTVVISLVMAYVVAYHFSASTIVYLLMRWVSDGQATDEIWRPGLVPGTLAPEPGNAPATPALPEPAESAEQPD